ncbi:hypothetical protein ES703_20842 [subsurface metagenome]
MADIEEMYTNRAEEIAQQRYGREFNDLPNSLQSQVWLEAERLVRDKVADQADLQYERMRERRNGSKETYFDELELMRRLGK